MILNPEAPKEGIYFNVPEPIYRKARGVSQSMLKECEYSMLHYKTALTVKHKPTPEQVNGTLLHGLVLQRKELFAVVPDNAPNKPTKKQLSAKQPSEDTKHAVQWWEAFRRLNPGKEFISREDADKLYAQRDAIMSHPDAAEMLSRSSKFEVAGFKKHHTGIMMKGLADCITTDDNNFTVIPDVKTCRVGGASYSEFQREIPKWGYHRQAHYYTEIFGASFFLFICVEKEPPYAVACYQADYGMIARGHQENERDLMRVAECERTGIWPGYSSGIVSISLPEWMR